MLTNHARKIFLLSVLSVSFLLNVDAAPPRKDLYQIRIYKLRTNEQMQQLDQFLKDAYLPALHRAGIKKAGVLKPLSNDTAVVKSVFVIIPFSSMKSFTDLDRKLRRDESYMTAGKSFREAPSDHAPYDRMESILLEAFNGQKHWILPEKKQGNIFELRSYESPTEKLHDKKVAMFENGEIELFRKLQFNTVFYAKVISGSRMPNFMYMPSFSSVDDRNAHWKTFGADAEWKAMSSDPVNENKVSVSHIDSILMQATDYSDL